MLWTGHPRGRRWKALMLSLALCSQALLLAVVSEW
jgi:hypothetical protein